MAKDMTAWLRRYDRMRHTNEINESWHSDKYPIEGLHWRELQRIYVEDLQMTWGSACSAIKKTWRVFKLGKLRGEYVTDLAMRINRLQDGMGIPRTEFEDLEHYDDGQEESDEEEWSESERESQSESESVEALHRQLRIEEMRENR